jgi:thiamine monophosphate synthase
MRAASRATILQLRNPLATARAIEEETAALVGTSPVPVVVSSRCDIALAIGAA